MTAFTARSNFFLWKRDSNGSFAFKGYRLSADSVSALGQLTEPPLSPKTLRGAPLYPQAK